MSDPGEGSAEAAIGDDLGGKKRGLEEQDDEEGPQPSKVVKGGEAEEAEGEGGNHVVQEEEKEEFLGDVDDEELSGEESGSDDAMDFSFLLNPGAYLNERVSTRTYTFSFVPETKIFSYIEWQKESRYQPLRMRYPSLALQRQRGVNPEILLRNLADMLGLMISAPLDLPPESLWEMLEVLLLRYSRIGFTMPRRRLQQITYIDQAVELLSTCSNVRIHSLSFFYI